MELKTDMDGMARMAKRTKMAPETIKALRSKARLLEPLVRIGKNGLTESAVLQVRKLLVKRNLVKVKFLRAFVDTNDRKEAARDLAEMTRSELVDQVGFVAVLYKR
ncbi:YhbY family RNA-binding protein [Candidatus Woesearchaeota archaeon]|nr:YhbY family RNA-binding protein [Candidatus Woesearchaeota archaeon]